VLGPVLVSAAFGFLKGFLVRGEPRGFDARMDFFGPVKEELVYRGAPLWALPGLPFGTTAVAFAVDHVMSDNRNSPMTTREMVARFGDVLLGGVLYETAARNSGIAMAIASHCAHNFSVSVGSRMRGPKLCR
jgi:membrane protease YdiL (CAAX protease family)